MLAPIQLLDYAITDLAYKQDLPSDGPLPEALGGVSLAFGLELSQPEGTAPEGTAHTYQILLQVAFNEGADGAPEGEEGHVYHRGHLQLLGWFRWKPPSGDFAEPEKLLLVNGASILYGIVRTHLSQLTEPGPAPRLLLPSVSFRHIVEQLREAPEEEAPDPAE